MGAARCGRTRFRAPQHGRQAGSATPLYQLYEPGARAARIAAPGTCQPLQGSFL